MSSENTLAGRLVDAERAEEHALRDALVSRSFADWERVYAARELAQTLRRQITDALRPNSIRSWDEAVRKRTRLPEDAKKRRRERMSYGV